MPIAKSPSFPKDKIRSTIRQVAGLPRGGLANKIDSTIAPPVDYDTEEKKVNVDDRDDNATNNESQLMPDDLKAQLEQQQLQLEACAIHNQTPMIGVPTMRVHPDGTKNLHYYFICPVNDCPIQTPFNRPQPRLARAESPIDMNKFFRRNAQN